MENFIKNLVKKVDEYIECEEALDMNFKDGLKILEKYGFDYSNRFELDAIQFVQNKRNELKKYINF